MALSELALSRCMECWATGKTLCCPFWTFFSLRPFEDKTCMDWAIIGIYLCLDSRRFLCLWINFFIVFYLLDLLPDMYLCIGLFNVAAMTLPLDIVKCLLGYFWLHVLGHVSSYWLLNVEPVPLPLDPELVPVVAAQCSQSVPVHVVL